jgi:hypothetical protein
MGNAGHCLAEPVCSLPARRHGRGIESLVSFLHKFIDSISTLGVPYASRADYSDLTVHPGGQTLTNASHRWINSYDSSAGPFTQTQPDCGRPDRYPTLLANTTFASHQFFNAYNSSTGIRKVTAGLWQSFRFVWRLLDEDDGRRRPIGSGTSAIETSAISSVTYATTHHRINRQTQTI